jgi:hypothetical protein
MCKTSLLGKSSIIIACLLISACKESSGPEENSVKYSSNSDNISVKGEHNAKIYRFLSAVRAAPSNLNYYQGGSTGLNDVARRRITSACVQELNFKTALPSGDINSAREFEMPVEANLYNEVVDVVKYREEVVPPKNVGGIIFKGESRMIPYTAREPSSTPILVRGICVGTEYILK